MSDKEIKLPRLRQDLNLYKGPVSDDGSPTWVINDPARHRFFKIGWPAFEIISRWGLGSPEKISERVNNDTQLEIETDDVEEMKTFLKDHQLLKPETDKDIERLLKNSEKKKQSPVKKIVRNYIFFRVPIVKPESFLEATYPYVKFFFSGYFWAVIVFAGLAGLFLAGRLWDEFINSLVYFFSVKGVIFFILALVLTKFVHELAHAYTAHRFGCKVASIGVAFIVLTPILYTDVSTAWTLRSRKDRFKIGAAGMIAEAGLASAALFLWSFFPEGALKSTMFLIATTSIVSTLLINIMPYMRFDGYYLLSDIIQTDNLFDRSFKMGRWKIREFLFGLNYPPPENLSSKMHYFMIFYAYFVWIYRFFLFLGIALFIYHFFFKALGLSLFLVEISWFIIFPVLNEIRQWNKLGSEMKLNFKIIRTFIILVLITGLCFIPWSRTIKARGVIRAKGYNMVYSPEDGVVEKIHYSYKDKVNKGDILISLSSPKLKYLINKTQIEIKMLKREIAYSGADFEKRERLLIAESELSMAKRKLKSLMDKKGRMAVSSPVDGKISFIKKNLKPGQWVSENTFLVSVINNEKKIITGYIEEKDISLISKNSKAWFYPEIPEEPKIKADIISIEKVGSSNIEYPFIASVYGGSLASRMGRNGKPVLEKGVYKAVFEINNLNSLKIDQERKGSLHIKGEPRSLFSRLYVFAAGVFIRESGF